MSGRTNPPHPDEGLEALARETADKLDADAQHHLLDSYARGDWDAAPIILDALHEATKERDAKWKLYADTTDKLIAHLCEKRDEKIAELRRKGHSGDCTIYAARLDDDPLAGICTCGYGWSRVRQCDWSEMYSAQYGDR